MWSGSMAIHSFWVGIAIIHKANTLTISNLTFAVMAIPRKKSRKAIRDGRQKIRQTLFTRFH